MRRWHSEQNRASKSGLWRAAGAGALGVFGLIATGCPSVATHHTATPVKEVTPYIAPGALALGGVVVPMVEAGARFPVGENIDIGAKVHTFGLGADVNIAVINDPSFALSINPTVSGIFLSASGEDDDGNEGSLSGGYGMAHANVLADVVKTPGLTLTVGAKPGVLFGAASVSDDDDSDTDADFQFAPGAMIAAKFMVGESFYVMPTVDAIYLVASEEPLIQPSIVLGW